MKKKVDAAFHYGISASFLSSALWEVYYIVLDMDNEWPDAWSEIPRSDCVVMNYKNYQHSYMPDTYYELYDSLNYNNYYEFSPSTWEYVGVFVNMKLTNDADFYRYSEGSGDAYWDMDSISWQFFED